MTKKRIMTDKFKKQYQLQIYIWISLFFIVIALLLTLILTYIALRAERQYTFREAQFLRLADRLSNASDFLTDAVRKYVVTGDPKYLQDYWYEVNVTRTREMVLSKLQGMKATANEIQLLAQAKENSDALVETEIRGMKLILSVLGVRDEAMPKPIQAYKLSFHDINLTPEEKIHLARNLMFDKSYTQAKKLIMRPISKFEVTMGMRLKQETSVARHRTNVLVIIDISLAVFAFIINLCSVWLRVFD